MSINQLIKEKLTELENVIHSLADKQKEIFVNWLYRHNKYLKNEKTYDYSKHLVYKRGMAIDVDFGFRVGSEYGGFHKAVVIQNDTKQARTVVVVPLSSLKEEQQTHN